MLKSPKGSPIFKFLGKKFCMYLSDFSVALPVASAKAEN
jgi:hypothetical protein